MPARRGKGWVSAGRCAGPAPIPALSRRLCPAGPDATAGGGLREEDEERRSPDERHPDPEARQ